MVQHLDREPVWRRISAYERVQCVAIIPVLLAPLGLALFLTPDLRGHGTHEQLGLPPCATMRFLGIPCWFCGMTTAVVWFAHGEFVRAFAVQPAAVCFSLGLLGASMVAAGCAIRGVAPIARATFRTRRALTAMVAVVVASWVYKIVVSVLL